MRFSVQTLPLLLLLLVACWSKKHEDKGKGHGMTQTGTHHHSKVDPQHVVIVISRGRSGSDRLCELVANIVEQSSTTLSTELFGGYEEAMALIKDPLARAVRFLSSAQMHSTWAGFKYKPVYFDSGYAKFTQWMGQSGVRVVFNSRNPLDELVSLAKQLVIGGDSHYHCKVGDKRCAAVVDKARVHLSTETLIDNIRQIYNETNAELARFEQYNVSYIAVCYEDLNTGTSARQFEQMKRIATFLGISRVLTQYVLHSNTVSTAPKKQADAIANYPDVVRTLTGTEYQSLLH
mmetsp:Transcript_23334/g.52347  ORF Transcript_23334/g.52347 Transcript_23334/m.52347 type:complete len:291 (-) Transcript_23334:1036-1908(-)